jgi:hypothetical protein
VVPPDTVASLNAVLGTGEEFSGEDPYAPTAVPRYTLYPLTVPELAVQESATACDDPDKEIVGELLALLAIDTLPLSTPVVVGANCTVRVAVWPGVRISPELMPEPLKPVPLTVTPEMVTLVFPVFVSVVGNDALWPACTVPKLRLVALALSE